MTKAITQDSDAHQPTEGQRPQPKKHPLIKRIFKCLGLGLLVVLIFAALIFQAPWKVITLLVIILAACTILPKWARKWFWLSAAAAVIVLAVWVFLPDGDADWRPYTFDEELAALQAKYAVPDEENAALIYDKLFETMDPDPNEPEFFLQSKPSSTNEPWLSKNHPETAEWLKGYQSRIEKLLQAAQKDKCSFPIAAEPTSFAQHMHRLALMRRCTWLLLSAANNDIGDGRIDSGLERFLCLVRMGKHLRQQVSVFECNVGPIIEGMGLTRLNRFVIENQPNARHLQLVSDSLNDLENNWHSDFSKVLEYDKLYCRNVFGLFYEVGSDGGVRLSRDPVAAIRTQFPFWSPAQRHRKYPKAFTGLGWLFLPSTVQGAADIIDATYEKYRPMGDPDFDWDRERSELSPRFRLNYMFIIDCLIASSERRYYTYHDIYLRSLAFRRGSRLLVGIRQYQIEHNAWPANLDAIKAAVPAEALIDPVTESELTYMNHGERFSLYGETANIWPK
jgi:hypothetical protein